MQRVILFLMSFSVLMAGAVDEKKGLIWQDDTSAKSITRNWSGAKAYCQNLNLLGFSDWYLPSKSELLTLVDTSKNINSSYYWSSTENNSDNTQAWYVYFYDGKAEPYYKNDENHVRCVRQEQTTNFEKIISILIARELQTLKKPSSEIQLIKGEFETTQEFDARVKNIRLEQKIKINKYKKSFLKMQKHAKNTAIKKALEITWGKPLLSNLQYDADNSLFIANVTFEAKKEFQKRVAIKIERKYARDFKQKFASLTPRAVFDYNGKSVQFKEIRIPYKKQSYTVAFTDMNIEDTKVAVNITNKIMMGNSFSDAISVVNKGLKKLDMSKLNNFNELDVLLKKSSSAPKDKHKWLFVVGIEQYDYTDNISYAKRSAQMFVQTVQKKLGVYQQNSYVLINEAASQAKIKTGMKKMLRRVKEGDTIYFYYNGHGVPVPSLQNAPFMLTADTEPDFVSDEKYFSLENIYSKLSNSKAKKVVAVVDSCFSGVTDGKSVLKGVAATKMVPKTVHFNKKKMVVLSAGTAKQYSNGYDKKAHRLFSFYIIKNIIQGDISIQKLYKDTKKETYETSLQEYGDLRVQSPTIDGNTKLGL